MLFSIDEDAGAHIVGWVMPDNPSTAPRVKVNIGNTSTVVTAEVYRPLLKEQGLHNTGICGFVVSERNVPGFVAEIDVTLVDADTGLLLYRRCPHSVIGQKLIMVETSFWPAVEIHQQFWPRFQMPYHMVERYNEETVRAVLGISFSKSVFVAGRIFVRQFDYLYRDRGFKSAILLRDPFEELAERIWILKWAQSPNRTSGAEHISSDVLAAAATMPSIDTLSPEGLSKTIRKLEHDHRILLSNPLTRQLSTRYPEDQLDPAAVAMALDALSIFDVVGMRVAIPEFVEAIYGALDYDGTIDTPTLPTPDSILGFVETLKVVPAALELIRLDYQVYTAVAEARKTVLA